MTLFIFLVCSQIPLYGIMSSDSSDPVGLTPLEHSISLHGLTARVWDH